MFEEKTDEKEPLVSIVVPVYNGERFIENTIDSVLAQTYENWELILVNDASTDRTSEIISRYKKSDNRIKEICHLANKGIAQTRNDGIVAAIGEYIAFVDSDDMWKSEKLEKQIAYMESNQCDFTYTAYDVIDEDGKYIKHIEPYLQKVNYKQLLNTNMIACCSVVIKSDIMKRNLMPELHHEDYATWLTILRDDVAYAEQVEGTLAYYRKVANSVSANKLKTIAWNWRIYSENQQLGFGRSVKQVIMFIFYTGRKYIKR